MRQLIQIGYLQEIPMSSPCSLCKSAMKIHDLRPCTSTHGKGEQQSLYCIRNCRWCRTADFSTKCTKTDHITCWQRHLPQEQEDNDPHEPLDPLQRLYVDAVTYS